MSVPTFTATPPHLPLPPVAASPHSEKTRVSIRQDNNKNNSNSNRPIDPVVLWTSSIARLCKKGNLTEAAQEFSRMRLSGVEPNHISFITLLSSCADFPARKSCRFGACIHGYVRKLRLDKENVMVGTALVDMYAKSGQVGLARLVFDEMGMKKNSMSWNTMIDGYMRNGEIGFAVNLFDEMPERDVISWTALINGFIKKGKFEQALECFYEMQCSGLEPDYVTVIAVLAACADLGTLGLGLWVNRFVMRQEFKNNTRISNSLIDMYSRCGCIEFARQVFEKMSERTLVSWNSIIVGFAVNGEAEEALEFFEKMQKEGFKPDGVTLTGALTACSHGGLVDEGLKIFDSMKRVHRVSPRIEHYGCIVDLYGRAGRFEDALNVIQNMPMRPNEVVLGSLLAACRTHGDVNLAERLTSFLLELDPGGDSVYVLLSNIYAAMGIWDGANKVRRWMKAKGVKKKPGFSSIEIDCCNHEFVAGDKFHADSEDIYAMLDLVFSELKLCGYVPKTSVIVDECHVEN